MRSEIPFVVLSSWFFTCFKIGCETHLPSFMCKKCLLQMFNTDSVSSFLPRRFICEKKSYNLSVFSEQKSKKSFRPTMFIAGRAWVPFYTRLGKGRTYRIVWCEPGSAAWWHLRPAGTGPPARSSTTCPGRGCSACTIRRSGCVCGV